MADAIDPVGANWDFISPSTVAQYGAATAVSAMSNTQLGVYLYQDVTLGLVGGGQNGLRARIADGRATWTDMGDFAYARRTLGLGQSI